MGMTRRDLLKKAGALPLLPLAGSAVGASPFGSAAGRTDKRVRPTDPDWPSLREWENLRGRLRGQLVKIESPFRACVNTPPNAACDVLFKELKNPYFIGDNPALTQTTGWYRAWTSQPSVYAVAAESAADVAAAVNFAREKRLRLVVKGGGHSYLGTSNAADSLLIWTRRMNAINLYDAFVPQGCDGKIAAQPAVSLGAGAIWMHVYDAVTTQAGRYVQGGGCATVGVAGLIQSGGFGSFSKNYGTAAASLLEAEVVTADGKILVTNACRHPELFWALKGGGGGSLGVVTRITLATHELPARFGGLFASVTARDDETYRRLVARTVRFYAEHLSNTHWGEMIGFEPGRVVKFALVFQGIDEDQVRALWKPYFDMVEHTEGVSFTEAPVVVDMPARHFWDGAYYRQHLPNRIIQDDRPGAPRDNVFWSGSLGETSQYLQDYESVWLPASLLANDRQFEFASALCAAARHHTINLHLNKGLAETPSAVAQRVRDTAMNPIVLDACALAIVVGSAGPTYPGVAGHEPDLKKADAVAKAVARSMQELYKVAPKHQTGAYVSESSYFDREYAQSYWGANYPRLLAAKKKYDPDGLFFVHNGVGSTDWSRDGFTRVRQRQSS